MQDLIHAGEDAGSHAAAGVLWRADGSWFSAEYWSHPIYRGGQQAGAVVTFLDITERLKLQTGFRQAQQRLRQVVVSSPAILFTLTVSADEILGISWISENFAPDLRVFTGRSGGRRLVTNGIHPEDLARVMGRIRADLFTQGHTTVEYRFRHADGHTAGPFARCG